MGLTGCAWVALQAGASPKALEGRQCVSIVRKDVEDTNTRTHKPFYTGQTPDRASPPARVLSVQLQRGGHVTFLRDEPRHPVGVTWLQVCQHRDLRLD